MTRWMYATGRTVAETDKAPAVDPAFKLDRCRDSTEITAEGDGAGRRALRVRGRTDYRPIARKYSA
jgi:hypothetical protein